MLTISRLLLLLTRRWSHMLSIVFFFSTTYLYLASYLPAHGTTETQLMGTGAVYGVALAPDASHQGRELLVSIIINSDQSTNLTARYLMPPSARDTLLFNRTDVNETLGITKTRSSPEKQEKLALCPECVRTQSSSLDRSLKEISYNESFIDNDTAQAFVIQDRTFQSLVTDYLISPGCNSSNNFLLAVQPSLLNRMSERYIVRNTWGSVARAQQWPRRFVNANVKVIFVVATPEAVEGQDSVKLYETVKKEAAFYDDILYLNMTDSYRNLTLKLLSAFQWVRDYCPNVQFVLKVDYDTFVNVPLLIDTLLHHQTLFQFSIVGKIYPHTARVKRWGRWGVSRSLYSPDLYPAYASGCGYVLSYMVLSQIVDAAPHVPMFSIEDAFITGVMRRVVGCRMFNFSKMFTHFTDVEWHECWMWEDKKILATNNDGERHVMIWNTFIEGRCNVPV